SPNANEALPDRWLTTGLRIIKPIFVLLLGCFQRSPAEIAGALAVPAMRDRPSGNSREMIDAAALTGKPGRIVGAAVRPNLSASSYPRGFRILSSSSRCVCTKAGAMEKARLSFIL